MFINTCPSVLCFVDMSKIHHIQKLQHFGTLLGKSHYEELTIAEYKAHCLRFEHFGDSPRIPAAVLMSPSMVYILDEDAKNICVPRCPPYPLGNEVAGSRGVSGKFIYNMCLYSIQYTFIVHSGPKFDRTAVFDRIRVLGYCQTLDLIPNFRGWSNVAVRSNVAEPCTYPREITMMLYNIIMISLLKIRTFVDDCHLPEMQKCQII